MPDPDLSPVDAFAERLNAAMEARELSQPDLVAKMETTQATVNRWVNGRVMPEGATMTLLALILGVSRRWLMHGVSDTEHTSRNPLYLARTRAGLTHKQLAQRTGYAIGVLQAVENGARASEKMIEAICAAIPGTSKEELMDGSDSPNIIREDASEATYGTKPNIILPPGTKARYVPLLSWAQAGQYHIGHTDEGYDHTAVLALDVNDPRAFAVEIEGNSMSPQLEPGDRVIVAPSWKPRAGDTVIARTVDGDVFCKLYAHSANGKLVLMSVNVNHPPIELSSEQVAWIYPVAQVTKNLRRS